MPYALLLVKPNRRLEDLGKKLAQALPDIIAPTLSLGERELHDGKVTPAEIMVWPVFGQETVNGKDLELLVLAHNFPERVANIEERKKQILMGIALFLGDYDEDPTVAVCVLPTLMAYGELKDMLNGLSATGALPLMKVWDFFTEERLRAVGGDTRSCNTVRNITGCMSHEDASGRTAYKVNCRTMAAFTKHYRTEEHLLKAARKAGCGGVGRKTISLLVDAVRAAGIQYPPQD